MIRSLRLVRQGDPGAAARIFGTAREGPQGDKNENGQKHYERSFGEERVIAELKNLFDHGIILLRYCPPRCSSAFAAGASSAGGDWAAETCEVPPSRLAVGAASAGGSSALGAGA